MKISVVIPVYNRPDEIDELLSSLTRQTEMGFEVVVVEDGSKIPCKTIVENYTGILDIHYYYKPNSGPGLSRNYGAERSSGDYIVFFDSDCVIPPTYIETAKKHILSDKTEFYGGPDKADKAFSPKQKAINYSMTSFFTTGGIRGGKKKLDKFFPRSFNMGLSRKVFEATGGFSDMRFGEDIDLSYRIMNLGFNSCLIPEAYVWHKRRNNLHSFFKQVFFSGIARINLSLRHPGTLRIVHLLPSAFTVCCFLLIICSLWYPSVLLLIGIISLIWFVDSSIQNRSIKIGLISILTSYIQLIGYGSGFLYGVWGRFIAKKDEKALNETKFY